MIQGLDRFNVNKLKQLLKEESREQTYLFITQADFLLDTYDNRELKHFFRFIDKQWNNFYQDTECMLIFGLISNDELEEQEIITTAGKSRILNLNELSR